MTVLVEQGHLPPDLASGQQVDVWVTPEPAPGAEAPAAAEVVLPAVAVASGPPEAAALSGSAAVPVVLQVAPADVARLLSATAAGRIDLVRVPRAAEVATPLAPADPARATGGG